MGEFQGNQHTDNEYDEYGYDDLVRDVGRLAEELGHRPTTEDAMESEHLPCLARIYSLGDSWNSILQDANLGGTVAGAYDESERAPMIQDLQSVAEQVESGILSSREYAARGDYLTSVIKEFFGSWSAACDAAAIRSGSRHGQTCTGPEGETLESIRELRVARMLHKHEIDYVVHPDVGNTNWKSDFYLTGFDVFIEVNGYADDRPNLESFREKIAFYESNGYDYLVVSDAGDLEERLDARGV